jgi:hypothetical protein
VGDCSRQNNRALSVGDCNRENMAESLMWKTARGQTRQGIQLDGKIEVDKTVGEQGRDPNEGAGSIPWILDYPVENSSREATTASSMADNGRLDMAECLMWDTVVSPSSPQSEKLVPYILACDFINHILRQKEARTKVEQYLLIKLAVWLLLQGSKYLEYI